MSHLSICQGLETALRLCPPCLRQKLSSQYDVVVVVFCQAVSYLCTAC